MLLSLITGLSSALGPKPVNNQPRGITPRIRVKECSRVVLHRYYRLRVYNIYGSFYIRMADGDIRGHPLCSLQWIDQRLVKTFHVHPHSIPLSLPTFPPSLLSYVPTLSLPSPHLSLHPSYTFTFLSPPPSFPPPVRSHLSQSPQYPSSQQLPKEVSIPKPWVSMFSPVLSLMSPHHPPNMRSVMSKS